MEIIVQFLSFLHIKQYLRSEQIRVFKGKELNPGPPKSSLRRKLQVDS